MTSSELIRLLQAADPDGTCPVCIDNEEITQVDRMEAYYDGRLEQFVRNGKAIVSAKLVVGGDKIKLRSFGILDMLLHNPEFPVECTTKTDEARVEAWRKEAREFKAKHP